MKQAVDSSQGCPNCHLTTKNIKKNTLSSHPPHFSFRYGAVASEQKLF